MTKIISEQKAKQGRSGSRVLMVLVGGLILAAIAWYAADFYGEAIDQPAAQSPGAAVPKPATTP